MRNLREYHRPRTVDEALRLLCREGLRSKAISGSPALMDDWPADAEAIVDLADLPLAYIETDPSGLRLGGMTKLQEIVDSRAARCFASGTLANAARITTGSVLRNQLSLADTLLCEELNPDLAALLLALRTEVQLQRLGGPTTLPLADLYEDIDAGIERAILAEVFIPAPEPDTRVRRCRLSRTRADKALLTVAAATACVDGVIRNLQLAAAGIGLRPRRLLRMESLLAGLRAENSAISQALSDLPAQICLPENHIASGEYRSQALQVLVARAILGD
jgi:carbon-monoxide dehydrogenase medium subunit